MTVTIAASILAADFARLGEEVAAAEAGGADLIHVDVMDGHFVPNISLGLPVVKALARVARVPLDVHLMISEPDRYLDAFVDAGADRLTVHVEVLPHLHRTLQRIRELGAKAGVAINPSTPVSVLEDVAADLDEILVMSVNPGFGGQTFIPRTASKVRAARVLLDAAGRAASIGVDGGIDPTTAPIVVGAGADLLIAGTSIFGEPDPADAIRRLRSTAIEALRPAPR